MRDTFASNLFAFIVATVNNLDIVAKITLAYTTRLKE